MSDAVPDQLPLFPLNAVLFPGMELPLHIFEERYRLLMTDRRGHDPAFGVVLITDGREVGDQPETARVGTAATIVASREYDDGRRDLVIRGGRRFRVVHRDWTQSYLVGTVDWLPDIDEEELGSTLVDAAWQAFLKLANAYLKQSKQFGMEPMHLESQARPSGLSSSALGFLLASRLPVPASDRQELLEVGSIADLMSTLVRIMTRERRLISRIGATVVIAGKGSADATSNLG